MSMTLWIILLVAAAAGLYAIIAFNRLVRARQMANEAWSGIDVQLKRRSDLIPNLVDSVKGYAAHERSVLEEVTQLRGAARALPADDVASRAQAEAALSGALGKLFAVAENYPDLKASGNFLDLQKQLSDLENELQMARRYYNGTVRNLNTLVQSFPSSLIAGLCGFGERAFFEVSDAADRAAPQVTLAPGQSQP
jgi:LemA protein